jgi:antitoxin component YwqK of YwqJK toxin-antitoxin module
MEEQILCYICFDKETEQNPYANNPRPCSCKGSIKIHRSCLDIILDNCRICTICKNRYNKEYLPTKDGREVIINRNDRGEIEEYTVNERGEKHGSYTFKDEYGQTLVYHSYIDGLMEGPYIEYYPNGRMKFVCRCKNNMIEGEYCEWYEDGSIKEESIYKNGRKDGESIEWSRKGAIRVASKKYYVEGELETCEIEEDY